MYQMYAMFLAVVLHYTVISQADLCRHMKSILHFNQNILLFAANSKICKF